MIPWGRLISTYEREIKRLFLTSGGVTPESLADLASSLDFRRAAWRVAESMVKGLSTANARTWREAAAKGTRSREIHAALKAELERTGAGSVITGIVTENAKLIRSIPLDVAAHITRFASEQQQKGLRAEEVAKELRRIAPDLTANKIRLISRTEIGKAETAITRARSEEIGVDWYQWMTSEDVRVRESHRNLDKVLVSWSDPPQPEALIGKDSRLGRGAPGEFPNCRCLSLPLVSLDEVTWPARVFTGGRIVRMSRADFRRIAGMPKAA